MLGDRDYMRPAWGGMGPGRRLREPLSATAKVMLACAMVWLLQALTLRPGATGLTGLLDLSWPDLARFQVWRLFTSTLTHDPTGFMHLGMNLFGIYMFGRPVEEALGRARFYTLFAISGVFGNILWLGFNYGSAASLVGASGALFGILAAAAMIYPNRIVLAFLLFPVRMRTFVIAYGAFELWAEFSKSGGQIAHLAHLGGMVGGFLYTRYALNGGGVVFEFDGLRRWCRRLLYCRPKLTMHPPPSRPTARTTRPAGPSEPEPDPLSQLDPILDKIGRHGMKSLTPREREILDQAREQLKGDRG